MHQAISNPLIYVVDDEECLTEMYSLALAAAGYRVRAFNHRVTVLAALEADRTPPDLLIVDYFGDVMPVEQFLRHCLETHPALRILMATGFCERDLRFHRTKPNHFIKKPFTPDEFLQAVREALIACPRPQ